MSSGVFGPRRVEPDYLKRWAKEAIQLIIRAPMSFTLLLLGLFAVEQIFNTSPKGTPVLLNIFMYIVSPLFWSLSFFVARYSDKQKLEVEVRPWTNTLLHCMKRVFVVTVLFVILSLILMAPTAKVIISEGVPGPTTLSLKWNHIHPASLCANCFVVGMLGRLCGMQQMLSAFHGISIDVADSLLNRAIDMNPSMIHFWFMLITILLVLPISIFYNVAHFAAPVVLVFLSALSYVAYRDIFEHEEKNAEKVKKAVLVPIHNV